MKNIGFNIGKDQRLHHTSLTSYQLVPCSNKFPGFKGQDLLTLRVWKPLQYEGHESIWLSYDNDEGSGGLVFVYDAFVTLDISV